MKSNDTKKSCKSYITWINWPLKYTDQFTRGCINWERTRFIRWSLFDVSFHDWKRKKRQIKSRWRRGTVVDYWIWRWLTKRKNSTLLFINDRCKFHGWNIDINIKTSSSAPVTFSPTVQWPGIDLWSRVSDDIGRRLNERMILFHILCIDLFIMN